MQTVEEPNIQAVPASVKKRSIVLRIAKDADLDAVYDCLMPSYFEEAAVEGYPQVIEDDAKAFILNVIQTGVPIIAECDGKIIGTIGLSNVPWWWNSTKRLFWAMWIYVKPEFRKGGTAGKLIDAIKEITDLNKSFAQIDVRTKNNSDLIGKLLQQKGFKKIGGNYFYEAKP